MMFEEDCLWIVFYGLDVRVDIEQVFYCNIGDLVCFVFVIYSVFVVFIVCMFNGMNGILMFQQVDEMLDVFVVYLCEVVGFVKGDWVVL